MFGLKGRKLTIEQIADAAAQMPPTRAGAFLAGAEFAGMTNVREKVLAVIDKARGSLSVAIADALQKIAVLKANIVDVRQGSDQAIADIVAARDVRIAGLDARVAELDTLVGSLTARQDKLDGLRVTFEAN